MADILIVGAGYTGSRTAALLSDSHRVLTAGRQPGDAIHLELPDGEPLRSLEGRDWLVLWTAPIADGVQGLTGKARRIVYLSTTGVYGNASIVNEDTPAAPVGARASARYQAESIVQSGPWSTCILRPAAIYGPGRGAHESIRQGRWRISGDGANYTSRIHVDDLARICAAVLLSDVEGAWPVADEEPCTNFEITRFCCDLLGLPLPASAPEAEIDETRRANRRVDGRAILRLIGIELQYPSYRVGIPASLGTAS